MAGILSQEVGHSATEAPECILVSSPIRMSFRTKQFERNRCQGTVDSSSGWFVLPRELAACAVGAAVVGEAAVRDRPASADLRARDWRHLLPHIGTGWRPRWTTPSPPCRRSHALQAEASEHRIPVAVG